MIELDKNPLLEWVIRRIGRQKNCIIICVGATGSGKTLLGLDFASKLSKRLGTNFRPKTNLAFNFTALLKKMKLPENQSAGTPFLFEEVGSAGGGASSREWQSKANRFFFSFMQTSRYKRQILILTCPNFSYLDKGARELTHVLLEMAGIDYNKKVSFAKPFILQVNPKSGKIYFKYLRFTLNKVKHKLKRIRAELPPEDILKEYDEMKKKFTDKLENDIIDADGKDNKDNKHKKKFDKEYIEYLINQGLTVGRIAEKVGCSERLVKYSKQDMKKSKEMGNKPNNFIENAKENAVLKGEEGN